MAATREVGSGPPRSDLDELSACFVHGCSRPPVDVAVGPGYDVASGPGVALAATCGVHRAAALEMWDHPSDVELVPATNEPAWAQALLAGLAGIVIWWLHR